MRSCRRFTKSQQKAINAAKAELRLQGKDLPIADRVELLERMVKQAASGTTAPQVVVPDPVVPPTVLCANGRCCCSGRIGGHTMGMHSHAQPGVQWKDQPSRLPYWDGSFHHLLPPTSNTLS